MNKMLFLALAAGAAYLLLNKKPSSAKTQEINDLINTGQQEKANQVAAVITGKSNTVAVQTPAPVKIQEVIIHENPHAIVIAQPVTSNQILNAVNAAIDTADSIGVEPPALTFSDYTPYGQPITVHTESIKDAAAYSGMSVEDWGHKYGFW